MLNYCFKAGITAQHCFHTGDSQWEKIVASCTQDYHSTALWLHLNPPLHFCPRHRRRRVLKQGCGRWSIRTYPFLSSQCLPYPFLETHTRIWRHTATRAEKLLTRTHAHVTHRSYVSVDAGGLTVRHSLPPTEQAWLSLSFTTSLIDLLIIFFTGDPPCRGSKAITLFCSVLVYPEYMKVKGPVHQITKKHTFSHLPLAVCRLFWFYFRGFEIYSILYNYFLPEKYLQWKLVTVSFMHYPHKPERHVQVFKCNFSVLCIAPTGAAADVSVVDILTSRYIKPKLSEWLDGEMRKWVIWQTDLNYSILL